MSANAFFALLRLLPNSPLQIGNISSVDGGVYDVALPGGNTIRARAGSDFAIGAAVFVRNGVIEGPAPDLPVTAIEV